MKITIRMDDITPGMDWGKFLRFKEILDKHGVKPLIGVVPDNKDPKLQIDKPHEDFWDYVKKLQAEGWSVAMHGFNHMYTTKSAGLFPLNRKSEFAGLSLQDQDAMLREGRRIFRAHNIPADIFMAPSHSYDHNTLVALKKNGFSRITDGFGAKPYQMSGMTFYPISVSKSKSLSSNEDGIVTFVYHANTMDDSDFESLEKLFTKAEVVSYSEFLKCDAAIRSTKERIVEYLTAKAKYFAVKARKLLK